PPTCELCAPARNGWHRDGSQPTAACWAFSLSAFSWESFSPTCGVAEARPPLAQRMSARPRRSATRHGHTHHELGGRVATSANLGFPRIGSDRELKRATEAYWSGRLPA